jgi:hypothetical protein
MRVSIAAIMPGLWRMDRNLYDPALAGEFADVILYRPDRLLKGEFVRQNNNDAFGNLRIGAALGSFRSIPEAFDIHCANAPIGRIKPGEQHPC